MITRLQEEKILGRKTYTTVSNEAKKLYTGKTILITGAAGSIGSHICKEIIKYQIDTLIMYDHNESGLYDLYQDLLLQDNSTNKVIVVGDICNENSLEHLFENHKPDIVFHAAAYKHVPIMENQPLEAVRTNILGAKLLADLSVKYDVKKFIFVSTDKAVNPSSILGATKRISELHLILKANQKSSDCQFISCRFGNVLESNGSVVPLIKKQIKHGGSVTITHPEVTRFFMSLAEATSFLLESSFIGNQGEILFFDMGKPIKILGLAKLLIASSNNTGSVEIIYTGLRPGEKIHEEEILPNTNSSSTPHPKIFRVITNSSLLKSFEKNFILLEKYFQEQNELEMVKTMKLLVPEFKSKVSRFEALDS
ncbi:polysaccharide biosynthesis protein [Reichenbachiella sp. MALMAid0571]|uniref:polysaccharide biosynthesis protein n=1 Tax=Reichenbachiella sp. MALMAid0571 TaxID=3143939 RepID=UPI0032DE9E04